MWSAIIGLIATVVFALTTPSLPADVQRAEKTYRVGLLGQGPPSFYSLRFHAFRQELHQRGYVEGHNIRYEYRYARGEVARLPALAVELVQLEVDVIVAISTPSTFCRLSSIRQPRGSGSLLAARPAATASQPGVARLCRTCTGAMGGGTEVKLEMAEEWRQ